MKTLILGSIGLLLFVVNTAGAGVVGINLISETHRVWGSNNGDVHAGSYDWSYPGTNYALPLSGECWGSWSSPDLSSFAASSAGNYEINANSTMPGYSDYYSEAAASSTYLFTPQTTFLEVKYYAYGSYSWEWYGNFILRDQTDDILMESLDAVHDFPTLPDEYSITNSYSVIPTHEYSLEFSVRAVNDYTTDGLIQGHLWVDIVPEPATVVLLGLGGLLIRKRKQYLLQAGS